MRPVAMTGIPHTKGALSLDVSNLRGLAEDLGVEYMRWADDGGQAADDR